MNYIKLSNIKITDPLFGSYTKLVADHILEYQWRVLNNQEKEAKPTYCIDNFRVAAGELKGERKGVVFQDTDLYKWLEAVSYCIANGSGTAFLHKAEQVIELIGRAQEPDGYLNTYFSIMAPERKWTNLVEGHELYTAGHLMEAAVAYYEATGKKTLLEIATKNADLICRVFGREDGQIHGYPGHQEVELGLLKLYRVTGNKNYLDCANYFIDERGTKPNYLEEEIKRRGGYEFFPEFTNYDLAYSQSHIKPVEQRTAEGHAVRAMYMCTAMAGLAKECNNEALLEACKAIWDNVTTKRMYITGGIGSSGMLERFTTDYDLPNATNYSETCASIGLMMFGREMNAVTGEAAYYDVVERALYNTVLAGINIQGNRYFYVNPLEMVPEFCTEHTYMDHVKAERQKWFDVACCPTNVARTLASLGQYIYAKEDDKVFVHQFISSEIHTALEAGELELIMESSLLQKGIVTLKITKEYEEKVEIRVRIPEYANHAVYKLGESDIVPKMQQGYACFELVGTGTVTLTLDFGVKPRWVAANDDVRADAGKVALVKGPCVYCLEEKENGDHLASVYVPLDGEITEGMPAEGLVGDVPTLNYQGIRIKNQEISKDELYGKPAFCVSKTDLTAIPYCLWNNRGKGEMMVWQKVRL